MTWLALMLLAQGVPERPMALNGLRPGMSAAEARALRPAGGRVTHRADRIVIDGEQVSDGCRADIHILHRSGRVEALVLQGEPAIAGLCGDAMLALVIRRHGQPASVERRRPFMRRARTTYTWRAGGIHLRFVYYAAGSGASALVDATNISWEMSVSESPEPVRL